MSSNPTMMGTLQVGDMVISGEMNVTGELQVNGTPADAKYADSGLVSVLSNTRPSTDIARAYSDNYTDTRAETKNIAEAKKQMTRDDIVKFKYGATMAQFADSPFTNYELEYVNGFVEKDAQLLIKLRSNTEDQELKDGRKWEDGQLYDVNGKWIPYMPHDHDITGKYYHELDVFTSSASTTFDDVANAFGFATLTTSNGDKMIYTGYDPTRISVGNTDAEGESYVTLRCTKDDTRPVPVDDPVAAASDFVAGTPYANFNNCHSTRVTSVNAFGVNGVIEIKAAMPAIEKGLFPAIWMMETRQKSGLLNSFKDGDVATYNKLVDECAGNNDRTDIRSRYNITTWGQDDSREIDIWEEAHYFNTDTYTNFSNVAWGAHEWHGNGISAGEYKKNRYVKLLKDMNDGEAHTWRFEREVFTEADVYGRTSKYTFSIDGKIYTQFYGKTDDGDYMYLLMNIAYMGGLNEQYTPEEQAAFDALPNDSLLGEMKVYHVKYYTNTPGHMIDMRQDTAHLKYIVNSIYPPVTNRDREVATTGVIETVNFGGATIGIPGGDYYEISGSGNWAYDGFKLPSGLNAESGMIMSFDTENALSGTTVVKFIFEVGSFGSPEYENKSVDVTFSPFHERQFLVVPPNSQGVPYTSMFFEFNQDSKIYLNNIRLRTLPQFATTGAMSTLNYGGATLADGNGYYEIAGSGNWAFDGFKSPAGLKVGGNVVMAFDAQSMLTESANLKLIFDTAEFGEAGNESVPASIVSISTTRERHFVSIPANTQGVPYKYFFMEFDADSNIFFDNVVFMNDHELTTTGAMSTLNYGGATLADGNGYYEIAGSGNWAFDGFKSPAGVGAIPLSTMSFDAQSMLAGTTDLKLIFDTAEFGQDGNESIPASIVTINNSLERKFVKVPLNSQDVSYKYFFMEFSQDSNIYFSNVRFEPVTLTPVVSTFDPLLLPMPKVTVPYATTDVLNAVNFGGATMAAGNGYYEIAGSGNWAFDGFKTPAGLGATGGTVMTFDAQSMLADSANLKLHFELGAFGAPDYESHTEVVSISTTIDTYTVNVPDNSMNLAYDTMFMEFDADSNIFFDNVVLEIPTDKQVKTRLTPDRKKEDYAPRVYRNVVGSLLTTNSGTRLSGSVLNFPSTAEPWGDFQLLDSPADNNIDTMYFKQGGSITITADTTQECNVIVTLQSDPYPDNAIENVLPEFNLTPGLKSYTIEIPENETDTYRNMRWQLSKRDVDVAIVGEIVIVEKSPPFTLGPLDFDSPFSVFGGATVTNGDTFEFPTGAQSWAGFQTITGRGTFKMTFPDGGRISFTASGYTADVGIQFQLEKNPYPDINPLYRPPAVTVTGDGDYTVDIAPQGSLGFTSFIMYFTTRDVPVTLTNMIVTADI